MGHAVKKIDGFKEDCPMDDFRALVRNVPSGDDAAEQKVYSRLLDMGRPGDFGRLAHVAGKMARWQGSYPPKIDTAALAMFATAHGSAAENITFSTNDDTLRNIELLRTGKSPLSAIAASMNAEVRVFDLAVGSPTGNILESQAMSAKDAAATLAYGFEAVHGKPDILALGVNSAGVGTIAAGLACHLYGGSPEYWLRVGTGSSVSFALERAGFVSKALAKHQSHITDPLSALCCIGGREITACVGAIIAARYQGVPVIIDGFATSVAAGIVHALNPRAIDHVFAAHVTQRPAHEAMLERLQLEPLLRMEFQTGGGLGSTTAIGLIRAACAPFAAEEQ